MDADNIWDEIGMEDGLSEGREPSEVEQLRADVKRLRAQLAQAQPLLDAAVAVYEPRREYDASDQKGTRTAHDVRVQVDLWRKYEDAARNVVKRALDFARAQAASAAKG